MIEIGRIFTFGIRNNRDIVRRLMGTSEFYKGLTFADALHAYRHAERSGLVRKTVEYIVVYHDCE
jgi:hypothetical protein